VGNKCPAVHERVKATWLILLSGVRNAAEDRFVLFFKTGSGNMGTGHSVLGLKRPGRDPDHLSGAGPTPIPPYAFVACKRKVYPVTGHESPDGE